MQYRKSERSTIEDDEDDIYDPKNKGFCRACVDVSTFSSLMKDQTWMENRAKLQCPPDKPEVGRASWTLLHTMAAYYPEKPTNKQQHDMMSFLTGFSSFYPCVPCAVDLRKNMSIYPPEVQNREGLSNWLCMQHNLVNKKIHKPLFDCSKVLERWRYGWKDGSCDIPDLD